MAYANCARLSHFFFLLVLAMWSHCFSCASLSDPSGSQCRWKSNLAKSGSSLHQLTKELDMYQGQHPITGGTARLAAVKEQTHSQIFAGGTRGFLAKIYSGFQ